LVRTLGFSMCFRLVAALRFMRMRLRRFRLLVLEGLLLLRHLCLKRLLRSAGFNGLAPAPPGESLLARAEAGKVTAAELAAIGRGSDSQVEPGSQGRQVELLRPGTQLHAQALGTAGVSGSAQVPDRSGEAFRTLAAAERRNAEKALESFFGSPDFGTPQTAGTATGTTDKPHVSKPIIPLA